MIRLLKDRVEDYVGMGCLNTCKKTLIADEIVCVRCINRLFFGNYIELVLK